MLIWNTRIWRSLRLNYTEINSVTGYKCDVVDISMAHYLPCSRMKSACHFSESGHNGACSFESI
jgi:hypothetical protein